MKKQTLKERIKIKKTYPLLPTASCSKEDFLKDEHGRVIYKSVAGWKRYGKRHAPMNFPNISVFVMDDKEANLLGYAFTFIRINYASNQRF